MSVTIQSIVDQISYDLLENSVSGPGLSLGIVTQQQVLDLIGQVAMDFLRQTAMVQAIYTQRITTNVSSYLVPGSLMTIYSMFVNAINIDQVDLYSDYLKGNWKAHPGQTKAWHADGLPIKTVEIVPPPNWTGTADAGTYGDFEPGHRNLTMVGSWLGVQETYGIGDTLSGVPDSFSPYVIFGVLARLFATDGEVKDPQRAAYCQARYFEGLNLGKSVLLDYLEEGGQDS